MQIRVENLMAGDIVNWAGVDHKVVKIEPYSGKRKDTYIVELLPVKPVPDVVAWGGTETVKLSKPSEEGL